MQFPYKLTVWHGITNSPTYSQHQIVSSSQSIAKKIVTHPYSHSNTDVLRYIWLLWLLQLYDVDCTEASLLTNPLLEVASTSDRSISE
jgi:hypothetical protein